MRAVVDPEWLTRSGAFYEIHHRDPENYPHQEAIYEKVAHAPSKWAERLGIYGMWIHGDVPAWTPGLTTRTPGLYRAYRKRHHAWPYSWVPFARSGDPTLLKHAERSTRQMIDAAYNHYGDETVERRVGPDRHRRKGIWTRSALPWVGSLGTAAYSYEAKVDFLLAAYYLTGYARAMENLLDGAEETKARAAGAENIGGGVGFRTHHNLLKTFVETYEATFDPWFLVAAHAIAEGYLNLYSGRGWSGQGTYTGDREFLRFSGCPMFKEYYLHHAEHWGGSLQTHAGLGWFTLGVPFIAPTAYAWHLSGEERYLRRAANFMDASYTAVYEAEEPDYLEGFYVRQSTATGIFTSYYPQLFAVAQAAVEAAGYLPTPLYHPFTCQLPVTIAFNKPEGEALTLHFSNVEPGRGNRWVDGRADYHVTGPGGDELFSGSWELRPNAFAGRLEPIQQVIPAETKSGVYRLHIEPEPGPHWTRSVLLPVFEEGVPEVLELAPGESMSGSGREAHYWFLVPGEVEQFEMVFALPSSGFFLGSLFNPDGERVWELSYHDVLDSPEAGKAVVNVPPAHRNRLWRVVMPHGGSFHMDERIPPIYAVSPRKWFDPAGRRVPDHDSLE